MIDVTKNPELDHDGMATYEYLVNNIETCAEQMPALVENLKRADTTGQFVASTARFLVAVDRERFAGWIAPLVEMAIEKDRERRYIWSLLEAIWGEDYADHIKELEQSDPNFRRVYKRVYPKEGI